MLGQVSVRIVQNSTVGSIRESRDMPPVKTQSSHEQALKLEMGKWLDVNGKMLFRTEGSDRLVVLENTVRFLERLEQAYRVSRSECMSHFHESIQIKYGNDEYDIGYLTNMVSRVQNFRRFKDLEDQCCELYVAIGKEIKLQRELKDTVQYLQRRIQNRLDSAPSRSLELITESDPQMKVLTQKLNDASNLLSAVTDNLRDMLFRQRCLDYEVRQIVFKKEPKDTSEEKS